MKEQKRSNNKECWEKNKVAIATKRKQKFEEKKKTDHSPLLKRCKSCKKNMGDKSILKHVSQKESCMKDYTEENMEYSRNWARERHNSKKSSQYKIKKSAVLSIRSVRYKKQREEKKEEVRKKEIEIKKVRLENFKEFHKDQARKYDSVFYSVIKDSFPQVFADFKTYILSEEDSKTVSLLESSIEDKNKKFENEIERIASLSRNLQYDRDRNSISTLANMYSKVPNKRTGPNKSTGEKFCQNK